MKNFSKFGLIHNFDPLHTGMITDWICSAMWSIISWWIKGFLSLFIAFKANVRMSIIPLPMFVFVCSPFRMVSSWPIKKSNTVCIFANLCSTLVCGSTFFQLGSTFCLNAQKKEKKANRDRQFFKDVTYIFWCYSV